MEKKLLLGIPIDTRKGFSYYPLKYRDYLMIGEKNYFFLMGFLKTIIFPLPNKNKIEKMLTYAEGVKTKTGEPLLFVFYQVMRCVLKIEEITLKENSVLWCGEILMNNKNFLKVLDILLFEYDEIIKNESEDEENPKDDKAKSILNKLREAKRKIDKAKRSDVEDTVSYSRILIKTCYDMGISTEGFIENSTIFCTRSLDNTSKQTILKAALLGADMKKVKMKDLF